MSVQCLAYNICCEYLHVSKDNARQMFAESVRVYGIYDLVIEIQEHDWLSRNELHDLILSSDHEELLKFFDIGDDQRSLAIYHPTVL